MAAGRNLSRAAWQRIGGGAAVFAQFYWLASECWWRARDGNDSRPSWSNGSGFVEAAVIESAVIGSVALAALPRHVRWGAVGGPEPVRLNRQRLPGTAARTRRRGGVGDSDQAVRQVPSADYRRPGWGGSKRPESLPALGHYGHR